MKQKNNENMQKHDHMNHERVDNNSSHEEHSTDEHSHHDHSHMLQEYKNKFIISLIVTIPILLLSPMIQDFFNFSISFKGDSYVLFILATFVFFYGGKPFLSGSVEEIKTKNLGMMTLIALAIVVSYVYSVLTTFFLPGANFFWELATLIIIMLIGHYIEMKSVMGASNALEKLVKLIPSEANLIDKSGNVCSIL